MIVEQRVGLLGESARGSELALKVKSTLYCPQINEETAGNNSAKGSRSIGGRRSAPGRRKRDLKTRPPIFQRLHR